MAVLINFKICDNAKECGGVAVCPTGALSFDEEKQTIIIDNDKCISCGKCEKECPIGAISVAKNKLEYDKIKQDIENDKRTTKDLFVDRYGASPLSEFFMIESEQLEDKIKHDGVVMIECYNDDSIQCLLKSIPIKELSKNLPKNTLFYKLEVSKEIIKEYKLNDFPTLLIFKDSKLCGKIEGYYTIDEKNILIEKINNLLNN
ncbi:MAG: 4Fe-4S binding protein [Bacilli bacterium]|nr:4Fe-4S binding protein [Bacilli bacterium]